MEHSAIEKELVTTLLHHELANAAYAYAEVSS